MLTKQEEYLESGIHIGTRLKTPYMKNFIYKVRPDKLYVMNLEKIDEKIDAAAQMIARYDNNKILVVASRLYAIEAATKFCELMGCKMVGGRFQPGMLTNPRSKHFFEPQLIIVSDPRTELQALKEAAFRGIPAIALVDTDNSARYVDLVIPCNNKGKKSLNLIYKLLALTVLKLHKDKDAEKKVNEIFKDEDLIVDENKQRAKTESKSDKRKSPKRKKNAEDEEERKD